MTTLTQAQRMSAYRQKMRDSGFRQITAWVLDTRNEKIREELRQECELIAQCPDNKEWLDIAEQNLNDFANEWKY